MGHPTHAATDFMDEDDFCHEYHVHDPNEEWYRTAIPDPELNEEYVVVLKQMLLRDRRSRHTPVLRRRDIRNSDTSSEVPFTVSARLDSDNRETEDDVTMEDLAGEVAELLEE